MKYSMLFENYQLGPILLKNKIIMAPLTRQCANDDGEPNDEMVAYYARRARGGVGLIITEGTYPSENLGAIGYLNQPGCCKKTHVKNWKKIVDAVHENGSSIILQLMHAGRVADPRTLKKNEKPVSSSSTKSDGWVLYTDSDDEKHDRGIKGDWPQINFPEAKSLTKIEIEEIANDFAKSASLAIEAGFDGVEVHGANGYLLYQFTDPKQNLRDDEFGGDAKKNLQFSRLICNKIRDAIGNNKIISYRISQDGVDDFDGFWEMGQKYVEEIAIELKSFPIDAIHWSSFDWKDNRFDKSQPPIPSTLKKISGMPIITNGGIYDGETAEEALKSGGADLIAIGRPLFAQPDWAYIVASGMPYNWVEFNRKYVIKPPYDYSYAYPTSLPNVNWPPDQDFRKK